MTTFRAFADRFDSEILVLHKPASQATMRSHLRELNRTFGAFPLSALDYSSVQRAFTAAAQHKQPKSVHNLYGTLHLVLAQAVREGLIPSIPKPVLPKSERGEQEWLTLDQMRTLIAAAEGDLRAFLFMLAETGMRIGEAVGSRVHNLDNQTLTVKESVYAGKSQSPKTPSSKRVISLSTHLASLLAGRGEPEEFLFRTQRGTAWWPSEVLAKTHALMTTLGIPPMGFHAFRRGNISMCAQTLGVPEAILAYRVGHRLPGVTLGVYCQPIAGADREWAQKIGDTLVGG